MTKERLLARRAAALANIESLEAGRQPTGRATWIECLNINRRLLAECDEKLAALAA